MLLTLASVYLAACALTRVGYRFVLYPAPIDPPVPLPHDATLLTARAADGTTVRALRFEPNEPGARTIVVFHGNGETVANRFDLAGALLSRGFRVILFEYRGYGMSRSDGSPSERALYLDASAMLDALRAQRIDARQTVLLGISLGTGVAAEMARQGFGASLVLVSPYTSITAMARRFAPVLPVSWLIGDRFDTLSKAKQITLPTLVVHGDADEVVPFAMGRQLAEAIPGARFVVVRGGHHNDVLVGEAIEAIVDVARG